MKILEGQEFFDAFNSSGLTFDTWLAKIEKSENREKLQNHSGESQFLRDELKNQLKNLKYKTYIMAIVADWCGDCQTYSPVLAHVAQSSPQIEMTFFIKEQNMELLKKINGGEKIPYTLFYSQDGYHIETWVERPTSTYQLMSQCRESFGFSDDIAPKFYEEYRTKFSENKKKYYNDAADEIVQKIIRSDAIQGTSKRINMKK